MPGWLRGLLAAAVVTGIPFAAWAGDVRVGFIDPADPPAFWNLVDATMRPAAAQLGIDLDIRSMESNHDKAIAVARQFLAEKPALDYLIVCNNLDIGGEIIKLADAAHVKMIFLNVDLDRKQWPEYGEPRTKYKDWLGSITPDHEGAGYGIATAILTAAAQVKSNRPLRVLGLTGEANTPASVERVRGLKRAIDDLTK